ncbi:hypothetical protein AKO1_014369 [Acrasis kona]|uniref:Uncharacterized protein n=1 Tax=Acrasis kona TaxID=1008807 RepID=A0AAW2Z0B7_9EUKA
MEYKNVQHTTKQPPANFHYANTPSIMAPPVCVRQDVYQDQEGVPIEQIEDISQMSFRFHGKLLLDYYYNIISQGIQAVPRSHLEHLMNTHHCYDHPQLYTFVPLTPMMESVLILLECVELVCLQRISKKKVAEQLFKIIRERINKRFDECTDSFELSCSMLFISEFLLGSGLHRNGRAYLSVGRIFFEENANSQDQYIRIMGHFLGLVDFCYCEDLLAQMKKFGSLILSWNVGPDTNLEQSNPRQYNNDVEYISSVLDNLDKMERQTKRFFYENSASHKNPQTNVYEESDQEVYKLSSQISQQDLQYGIVIVGLRLKVYLQQCQNNTTWTSQSMNEMKHCADKISHMTQSPWFDTCGICVIEPIVCMVKAHLHDPDTSLWLLNVDSRALHSLDLRFDIVTKMYTSLQVDLSDRIMLRQQHVQQQQQQIQQMQQVQQQLPNNLIKFLATDRDYNQPSIEDDSMHRFNFNNNNNNDALFVNANNNHVVERHENTHSVL